MNPRFSVLLPTHDRADVIGFAIRSVLRQTEPDFELLVVGDGCTDGTAGVVAGFADPRIRWFDLPKAPGFGYANRNIVLREARGELLAFAAHDDLILPDHLALLATPFRQPGIEWAYSRPVWVADDGVIVPFAVDLGKPDQLDQFLTRLNTIPAPCVMYRRSCLERYGFWPEEVPHSADWEYWKRIIGGSRGANLAYVPLATTLHFRADWRPGATWGPPPLDAWLRAAAETQSWPAALRARVAPGESVQGALWRLIDGDPGGWPAALRAGIAEAMDLLAWTAAATLPGIVRELGSIVLALSRAGSPNEAVSIVDQALLIAPLDAGLHLARGVALLASGAVADAEVAFRRALELDPTVPDHHAQLSVALNRLGRADEAIAEARQAIALKPTGARLHHRLGHLLARHGRLTEAESPLREALRLDPDLATAADDLADVSRRLAEGGG